LEIIIDLPIGFPINNIISLHIIVFHPQFGTFWPLESPGMNHEHLLFFGRTFYCWSQSKRKEVRGSLQEQGIGTGTMGNNACSPMFPEHVPEH